MITEKQKTISEQAVYGDLMGYDLKDAYYSKNPSTIVGFQGQLVYIGCDLNKVEAIKPILRPLSDLTKEITHRGYNNDEPFIPLVELARTAQGSNTTTQFKLQDDMVVDFTIAYHFKKNVMWFNSLQGAKQVYVISNQNKYFDLLNLWHFDTRNLIESNEAISTDEVNPYEVK